MIIVTYTVHELALRTAGPFSDLAKLCVQLNFADYQGGFMIDRIFDIGFQKSGMRNSEYDRNKQGHSLLRRLSFWIA